MYLRAFPKPHHCQAAQSILGLTISGGFLGSRVRKGATQCSLPVSAIGRRAISSKSVEKDIAARPEVRDLHHTKHKRKRQLRTKDIFVDDLQATLEAHRATNRAAVIRRFPTTVPPTADDGIYRPPLDEPLARHEKPEHKVDDGEYIGRNIRPQVFWHVRSPQDIHRPWLALVDGYDGDGLTRLEAEMRAYESYMRLTAAEERACQLVIEEITSIVGTALPNSPLEVVGSHRTGLATPTSDIDVRFLMPEYERKDSSGRGSKAATPKARKARDKKLRRLCNALCKSPRFVNATLVFARVPIVRVLHRRTGLTLNIQSLRPSLAARTCVAAYLSEYPTLRPLYMILRFALEIRHLTTVFEGGFGSYAIFMMIVNALKHASVSPSTGHEATRYDLAAHLLWVLDFYATADLRKNGYSLDPPSVFPKVVKRGQSKGTLQTYKTLKTVLREPYLLCLQDPADPLNDLGRKSSSIKHVQEVFRQTSRTLRDRLVDWDNSSSKGRDPEQKSLLDTLVGAHYGHFKEKRRILAKAAAQAEKGNWGLGDRTHVPIPLGIRGGARREF